MLKKGIIKKLGNFQQQQQQQQQQQHTDISEMNFMVTNERIFFNSIEKRRVKF